MIFIIFVINFRFGRILRHFTYLAHIHLGTMQKNTLINYLLFPLKSSSMSLRTAEPRSFSGRR